jgi:hypothetical protein
MREVTIKYGRLVVFTRHDSAGICEFRYGLTLVNSTPKIMAGAGVFVRVARAFRRPLAASHKHKA